MGLAALNGFYLPSAALAAQHTGMTLTPVDLAQAPVMRWGWFFIGAYVLAGLISAAACCQMAYSRNLSPAFWFGAGLATNLLAVAAVMSRPRAGKTLPPGLAKIPSTADPALCPGCGARNHPAASACLNCGAALSPAYEPESRRAGR